MTLIHGAGSQRPASSTVTYSRPSAANPPNPLKNSRSGGTATGCGAAPRAATRFGGGAGAVSASWRRLSCSASVPRRPTSTARAMASSRASRLRRDEIGAQHEHGAARDVRSGLRPRLAGPDQRLQGDLKVLDVGDGPFVQDHEIDGELLHAPVLVGAQHLADDGDVLDVVDAHQHDRQVAGNALRPERRRAAAAAADGVGRRPQRRIGVDHVAGETLKQARLVRRRCRGGSTAPAPGSTPGCAARSKAVAS